MKTLKNIAIIMLLLTTAYATQAQQFTKKKRYWNITVTLDAMNYFGDVVPRQPVTSFDLKFTKPKMGFYLQRRLTPNISFRGGMAYGVLAGDDATSATKGLKKEPDALYRQYRNLHFRNRVAELSGVMVFDLIQNRGMFYQRSDKPVPYAFVGLGMVYSNPQAKTPSEDTWSDPVATDTWVSLRKYQTEGKSYSPLVVSVPIGIGVRYKVSNKIDIGFEIGYRWTFTDYLDDVSGRYYGGHTKGTLAYALANRSLEGKESLTGNDRSAIVTQIQTQYPASGGFAAGESYSRPYEAGVFYGEKRGSDGTPYDQPDARKARFNGYNDVYMVYGFHASYILAMGVKCPKFR